jgi:hypothetical protein
MNMARGHQGYDNSLLFRHLDCLWPQKSRKLTFFPFMDFGTSNSHQSCINPIIISNIPCNEVPSQVWARQICAQNVDCKPSERCGQPDKLCAFLSFRAVCDNSVCSLQLSSNISLHICMAHILYKNYLQTTIRSKQCFWWQLTTFWG